MAVKILLKMFFELIIFLPTKKDVGFQRHLNRNIVLIFNTIAIYWVIIVNVVFDFVLHWNLWRNQHCNQHFTLFLRFLNSIHFIKKFNYLLFIYCFVKVMEINTENNVNIESTEIVTNSQVLNEGFVYKIYIFFKF